MTTQEMESLKKHDKVAHKRYGESYVMKVIPDFGPVILPLTREGLLKLQSDSGAVAGQPYLCSDYRQNLKKIQ